MEKEKEKFLFPSLPGLSAPWPFLSPRPSTTASAPAHPFPARPSFAPAAQPRPAQQPRASASPAPGNRPRPAADARAPPLGAAPNLPRPAPTPGQGGTAVQRPGVVGAPPSCPSASLKASRAPPRAPLLPRSNFAPLTHRRPQQPSFRGRRISPSTSARAAVSEPSPPPIFARGELAVVPSLSPCISFRVSWLIAPNPRAP